MHSVCSFVAIVTVVFAGCSNTPGKADDEAMDPVLRKLFDDSDDFSLVNALAGAIPDSSEDELPRPQQVVRTVWNASGLIGNGGLWAFFRSDLDTEELMVALEEIGAIASVAAIRQAISVFPNSETQSDWVDRGDYLDALSNEKNQVINSATNAFYAADKELLRILGKYARSHADSFNGLEAGWVAREYVENLRPLPDADADPREVALWILGLGGHVQFPDIDGEIQFFNSLHSPIPKGDVVITEVGLPDTRTDNATTLSHLSKVTSINDTLATVSFQNCEFSEAMLGDLANLRALRCVDLSQTKIKNHDLAGISKLPLIELSLAGTQISDEGVAYLASMPKLQSLDLTRTEVTIECVKMLANLPELRRVDLPTKLLSDENLKQLVTLSSLRTLNLSRSQVSDEGLMLVGGLENLESLDLESCPISNSGLAALSGLHKLKSLGLRYTGIADAGLNHLENLNRLECLDLDSTRVTSGCFASIAKLTALRSLVLDSTMVTDEAFEKLLPLKKLDSLSLYETAVGDLAMKFIGKLTNLSDLSLSETQVTDAGIAELAELTRLRDFSFMDTQVTDKSIPVISGFTEVRRMYMSDHISSRGEGTLKKALIYWN